MTSDTFYDTSVFAYLNDVILLVTACVKRPRERESKTSSIASWDFFEMEVVAVLVPVDLDEGRAVRVDVLQDRREPKEHL